jgi:hypothetical protein
MCILTHVFIGWYESLLKKFLYEGVRKIMAHSQELNNMTFFSPFSYRTDYKANYDAIILFNVLFLLLHIKWD